MILASGFVVVSRTAIMVWLQQCIFDVVFHVHLRILFLCLWYNTIQVMVFIHVYCLSSCNSDSSCNGPQQGVWKIGLVCDHSGQEADFTVSSNKVFPFQTRS